MTGRTGNLALNHENVLPRKKLYPQQMWTSAIRLRGRLNSFGEKITSRDDAPPSDESPVKTRLVHDRERGANPEVGRRKAHPVERDVTQRSYVCHLTCSKAIAFDEMPLVLAIHAMRRWKLLSTRLPARVLEWRTLRTSMAEILCLKHRQGVHCLLTIRNNRNRNDTRNCAAHFSATDGSSE